MLARLRSPFLLGPIGLLIIACMSKTDEARVQEAAARLRAEEEARRRLDAEWEAWPHHNPWDEEPPEVRRR